MRPQDLLAAGRMHRDTMDDYNDFIAAKTAVSTRGGPDVTPDRVHPKLHPWQQEIVAWAARTKRAAIWADTGLGKTFMMIEWARLSGPTSLIVAPLAVCAQTVREAAKLGITAAYVRDGSEITGPGIWVTNYERVESINPDLIDAVALDESSILKQSTGKTRTMLIEHFVDVPARLACSATPAPNDPEELTNQAEFLGRMARNHMLAAYFVHDQINAGGYRLKGHALKPMVEWMTTWAVAIRRPSDIGGDDTGYILPGLDIVPHYITAEIETEGQLFATELGGVSGRAQVRRSTLTKRCDRAVQLVYDCGSQGVQQGVLRVQQGQVEADARAAREAERSSSQEVCGGQGVSRPHTAAGLGVQEAPPASTSGASVRPGQGRHRDDDRPGLPDLRSESACGPDSQDAHRPRPSDRHGPRCSLPVVQSGIGAHGRRHGKGYGDVPVPPACTDQWVIWCGLNDEQDYLARTFGSDARSIDGRTNLEERVAINDAWIRGDFRVLLVKPGMYSQGMNWQHCCRMAFVGLSDSYEQYYQCVRRCYRYGQTRVVQAHIILSDLESQIADNVARKEKQASVITEALINHARKDHAAA